MITAADLESGEGAFSVALFTLFSLVVFWVAHSYSEILGRWSADGTAPGIASIRAELSREWPMVVAPLVPLLVLVAGGVGSISDEAAINTASGLCVLELCFTSFFAARRGGAGIALAVLATLISASFGVSIILLKLLLH